MALQRCGMIRHSYKTPLFVPQWPKLSRLADFHSHLVMQAGAYQSGAWVVVTAKAGWEEGCDLIGESCIVAPTGQIVAMATTVEDELVVAPCDLDAAQEIKRNRWNFAKNREPQHYRLIVEQRGRSEERRVGKEWCSTCRSGWSPTQ